MPTAKVGGLAVVEGAEVGKVVVMRWRWDENAMDFSSCYRWNRMACDSAVMTGDWVSKVRSCEGVAEGLEIWHGSCRNHEGSAQAAGR